MKIAVSFLKSQFDKKTTIKKIEDTDCDFIHVDVMDGIFVENSTEELTQYLLNIEKKLDVHLMVEQPLEYIENYKNLNTEYITIHEEINDDVLSLLKQIKSYGIKCGIAINPNTPIDNIKEYLSLVDQVLIMSVVPGKGGQVFMPDVIPKVKELVNLRKDYNYIINIDGGINSSSIDLIKNIGLDMIVSGSYICESDDYQNQINRLR